MARTEVGKAVYSMLSGASAVTALVSTRIYPVVAPQDTLAPFVVYGIVSSIPTNTKDRISELDTMRVQVDCYGKTYSSAEAVGSAVRLAIDGVTGTKGGVYVDGVAYESEEDMMEEQPDYFRKSIDFFIRVKY